MKKLALLFIASICLQVGAVTPPKPVEGTPGIFTKTFVTTLGGASIALNIPSNWGIGQMSTRETAAEFTLFPTKHGFGCQIFVVVGLCVQFIE